MSGNTPSDYRIARIAAEAARDNKAKTEAHVAGWGKMPTRTRRAIGSMVEVVAKASHTPSSVAYLEWKKGLAASFLGGTIADWQAVRAADRAAIESDLSIVILSECERFSVNAPMSAPTLTR